MCTNSYLKSFYAGKVVLITNANAFVGKILVEKLLRSCIDVKKLILISEIQDSEADTANEYFSDEIFTAIKTNTNFLTKVMFMNVDFTQENLDIHSEELTTLLDSVNIIFHTHSEVNFSQTLSQAIHHYLQNINSVINLSKGMKNLEAFVYTSTAFIHQDIQIIEEKIYPCTMPPSNLLNLNKNWDYKIVDAIFPLIMENFPNPYVYIKAVCERLIKEKCSNQAIAIVRPFMIFPTYKEPIPGYVSDSYGPLGLIYAVKAGLVKISMGDSDSNCQCIPCDFLVNSLLAVAWETSTNWKGEIKIYNFAFNNNFMSRKIFITKTVTSSHMLQCAVWYPTCPYIVFNKSVYRILAFLLHTIPGFIADCVLRTIGQKERFVKIYDKIYRSNLLSSFLICRNWTFNTDNIQALWSKLSPQDKIAFNFDLENINWDEYANNVSYALKVYIAKEDLSDMQKTEKKHFRLKILHLFLKYATIFMLCIILYKLILE